MSLSTAEYTRFRAGKSKEIERLELQANSFSDVFKKQIQLLNIKSGSKVLDAGCGTGSFARNVAPIVAPERVTAVDIDPVFIEEAKKLSAKDGRTNIAFQVGNVESLDFLQNEIYDAVYCRLVIPHVSDPVRAISELKRVAKKGGIIASSDEGDLFTYPPIGRFFGLFEKVAQWRKATQNHVEANRQTAFELFESVGISEVRIFPIPNFASNSESREKLRDLAATPIQILDMYKDDVISKGFMSESEYNEGVLELKSWLERPDSFWMALSIFTIGKA